jgi:hypothetical protein
MTPQVIPAHEAKAAEATRKLLQAGIMGGQMALQFVAVSKSLGAVCTHVVSRTNHRKFLWCHYARVQGWITKDLRLLYPHTAELQN